MTKAEAKREQIKNDLLVILQDTTATEIVAKAVLQAIMEDIEELIHLSVESFADEYIDHAWWEGVKP